MPRFQREISLGKDTNFLFLNIFWDVFCYDTKNDFGIRFILRFLERDVNGKEYDVRKGY